MPIALEDLLILARSLKGLPPTQLHRIEVIGPMLGQAQLLELKTMLEDEAKKELDVMDAVGREYVHFKSRKVKKERDLQEASETSANLEEAEALLKQL